MGVVYTQVPATSRFRCIFMCTSNVSCKGFLYWIGCLHADRRSVIGLEFNGAKTVNLKKEILMQDLAYDTKFLNMTNTVGLISKLSVGDMLFMRAVLLQHKNVMLQLFEKSDFVNVTYEVRAKCVDEMTCAAKCVTIANKVNNSWNKTMYLSNTAYTLVVNETFDLHLLITARGIMTYLKGVYLHTLSTPMSINDVNFMKSLMYMKVTLVFSMKVVLVFSMKVALVFSTKVTLVFSMKVALVFSTKVALVFSMKVALVFSMKVALVFSMKAALVFSMKVALAFSMKVALAFSMKVALAFSMKVALVFSMKVALVFSMKTALVFSMKVALVFSMKATLVLRLSSFSQTFETCGPLENMFFFF
ncbi:hypothetical protein Btru_042970 [Bulinus truncatus]|nr:hypothetical protein Btru_042970 [Bulinus truncatus]